MYQKNSLKKQIKEKLEELERKRTDLIRSNGYSHIRGLEYKPFTQSPEFYAIIVILLIAVSVCGAVSLMSGFSLGIAGVISTLIFVYYSNKKAHEEYKAGEIGTVIICFYSQRLLDEICEQIALVDKNLETARIFEAERKKQVEIARKKELCEAKPLRGQFDKLFEIIRTELGGEVKGSGENGEVLDTDIEVRVNLPIASDGYLRYEWWTFRFTQVELDRLIFRVSQIRPAMTNYHSLKESLGTTALSKQ